MSTKVFLLILFFAASVSGGIGFVMGNLMSDYGNNLCYSAVVTQLSEKAVHVVGSQDGVATEKFVDLVGSLPNNAKESSCREMQRMLSDF